MGFRVLFDIFSRTKVNPYPAVVFFSRECRAISARTYVQSDPALYSSLRYHKFLSTKPPSNDIHQIEFSEIENNSISAGKRITRNEMDNKESKG